MNSVRRKAKQNSFEQVAEFAKTWSGYDRLLQILANSAASKRATLFGVALLLPVILIGCGKPDPSQRYQRPEQITDFQTLFGKNCSGCHGMDGQLGPAPPLHDPLFQAIISDEQLTSVIRSGREGTLMPAFARSAGGPLTEQQGTVRFVSTAPTPVPTTTWSCCLCCPDGIWRATSDARESDVIPNGRIWPL